MSGATGSSRFVIPGEQYQQLARGLGGAETLATLQGAYHSANMVRVAALHTHWQPLDSQAIDILSAVQRQDKTASDRILRDPMFGAWAEQALTEQDSSRAQLLHHQLGMFAMEAALLTGADHSLQVPVIGNNVTIHGQGRGYVGDNTVATLTSTKDGLSIRAGEYAYYLGRNGVDSPAGIWQPYRYVHGGSGDTAIRVRIEDQSPFRSCFAHGVQSRLGEREYEAWQRDFAGAWDILWNDFPEYAAGLRQGLQAIVPAGEQPHGFVRTMAAAVGFGALAMGKPQDALHFAANLVNGFQKMKLLLLRDMLAYVQPNGHPSRDQLVFSPSRDTAGHPSTVFHDAYTNAGLAHFFAERLRRARTKTDRRLAEIGVGRWYEETVAALDKLRTSGFLAARGTELYDTLEQTVRDRVGPLYNGLPGRLESVLHCMQLDRKLGQQIYNSVPHAETVRQLAEDFLIGHPPGPMPTKTMVPAPDTQCLQGTRNRLVLHELHHSRRIAFAQLSREPETSLAFRNLHPGDLQLVAGNSKAARRAYRETLLAHPGDKEAWIGYILTCVGDIEKTAANWQLLDEADTVMAVHGQLPTQTPPEQLIAWLFGDATLRPESFGATEGP